MSSEHKPFDGFCDDQRPYVTTHFSLEIDKFCLIAVPQNFADGQIIH